MEEISVGDLRNQTSIWLDEAQTKAVKVVTWPSRHKGRGKMREPVIIISESDYLRLKGD